MAPYRGLMYIFFVNHCRGLVCVRRRKLIVGILVGITSRSVVTASRNYGSIYLVRNKKGPRLRRLGPRLRSGHRLAHFHEYVIQPMRSGFPSGSAFTPHAPAGARGFTRHASEPLTPGPKQRNTVHNLVVFTCQLWSAFSSIKVSGCIGADG